MAKTSRRTSAKNIDEYLDVLPQKVKATLENLRSTIKAIAPQAEEVISYQIPMFKYQGPLVSFAAFKDHCSFFVMSPAVINAFTNELKGYDTATGTVHFPLDKPLPPAMVKKLVIARIKENEEKFAAKQNKKSNPKKTNSTKLSAAGEVDEYMAKLKHPLKAEIEAVRAVIKGSNSMIAERIKWSAPSYHYKKADLVTFNGWALKQVHLVFHHPAIVKIKSAILKGDYPTRRMVYFNSMKEIKANKKELERIIGQLIEKVDSKQK